MKKKKHYNKKNQLKINKHKHSVKISTEKWKKKEEKRIVQILSYNSLQYVSIW